MLIERRFVTSRLRVSFVRSRLVHMHSREGEVWMVRHRSGSKTRSPLWFLVVAVVAALALVAAGCGSDDDEASGTDTTATGFK